MLAVSTERAKHLSKNKINVTDHLFLESYNIINWFFDNFFVFSYKIRVKYKVSHKLKQCSQDLIIKMAQSKARYWNLYVIEMV